MNIDPKNRAFYPVDAVIKMSIGNNVRRIYLDRIANEDGLLSYCLLARWAVLYASTLNFEENDTTLNDWTSLARLFAVEITYVDDEMDNICFSSDEELVDALLQFSKLKHTSNSSVVLRCKAVVQDRKLKGKKSKKTKDSETNGRDRKLKEKNSKKSNDSGTNGKDNSSHAGQVSRDRSHACPKLSAQCSSPRNLSGFDREFVHARHTCDGCGTAPIIGLRYHAVNISDYDYCETCMANYHGEEVTFQLEQLDCDERFQIRTKEKQCERGNLLEVKSVEGSEAFSNQEATHRKYQSELTEKKVGLENFRDNENASKAIDVIGMGIIQSASIFASVLCDIMENSQKTQDTYNNTVPNLEQLHTGSVSFQDEEVESKLKDVSYAADFDELLSLSIQAAIHSSPCLSTDAVEQLNSENYLEVKHKDTLKEPVCSTVESSNEDEWNMVESGEDALVTIGSALYREDLVRSTVELYVNKDPNAEPALRGNECVSSASPSVELKSRDAEGLSCTHNVQESNNPVLLARWDKELDELRQMGFIDDLKSLEALETLEAAEIGVNSENGITTTMAVNWLLNNAENK